MPPRPPFFTILTPTRNRAALLEKAIRSVATQDFQDFEHRIYDAVSTDGTAEMIAGFPHVVFTSAPDRGHFDAFNKGLSQARGEVVGFLNSDDFLEPGTLADVAKAFQDPRVEVASGGAKEVSVNGAGEYRTLREYLSAEDVALTFRNVLRGQPLINARFFRRSLVARIGNFDLRFPIGSDRDWMIGAALEAPHEVVLDRFVYNYLHHDDSLTFNDSGKSILAYRQEHVGMAEKHLRKPALPRAVRSQLRTFHARESAWLTVEHWRARRRGEAWQWARRGWSENRLWPFSLARRAAGHALGY